MEYNVIYKESLNELVKEVNIKIKDGWKPIGGITTLLLPLPLKPEETFSCFCQEILKED